MLERLVYRLRSILGYRLKPGILGHQERTGQLRKGHAPGLPGLAFGLSLGSYRIKHTAPQRRLN